MTSGAKSEQSLNLYKLIQVLHTEPTYVSTQVLLFSNGVIIQYS